MTKIEDTEHIETADESKYITRRSWMCDVCKTKSGTLLQEFSISVSFIQYGTCGNYRKPAHICDKCEKRLESYLVKIGLEKSKSRVRNLQ